MKKSMLCVGLVFGLGVMGPLSGKSHNKLDANHELLKLSQGRSARSLRNFLKNNQPNINVVSHSGYTPLMLAAINNREGVVDVLLAQKGINVNALTLAKRQTAVMLAAEKGYDHIVKALVKAKAKLDLQDLQGSTALMFAARKGSEDTVKELIRAGVKLDLQDMQGNTALMFAAKNGHEDVVEALRDAGANLNLQNYAKQSALMFASMQGKDEIVDELLEGRAKVDLKDRQGKTALMLAEKLRKTRKKNEIMRSLQKAGAQK